MQDNKTILTDTVTADAVVPEKHDIIRNPDGTFIKGVSANPAGRPKGETLKVYQAAKFREMSIEEKEKFLADIPKEIRWRMSEGNPAQDVTSAGEKLIPTPILGGIATDISHEIQGHDSTTENPLS